MGEIKLVIEGDPLSVNQTYKTRKGNRMMYLSPKAMVYAESVRWQAKSKYRGPVLKGDLEVSYFYYFKDRRRRDHLNFNKILNDHLNQIIWQDDQQIITSHHYTRIDVKNPRIELFIRVI